MVLIKVLFLSCLFGNIMGNDSSKIEKIELRDSLSIKLINKYVEAHDFFDNQEINPVILLKYEKKANSKIIYVGSTYLMSEFVNNIPDKYGLMNGVTFFIYEDDGSDCSVSFSSFWENFRNHLYNDVLKSGQFNNNYTPSFFISPEYWRVIVEGDQIEKIQNIVKFPSTSFRQEYTYNDNGDLMYKDGVYANAEISPEPPLGFSIVDYLKKSTSIKIEENLDITLTFVIDEKGNATDINVEGLIEEKLEREIIKALRKMPTWSPGIVNGKQVKVRDSYGLKEF